jgi:hypothetical protein
VPSGFWRHIVTSFCCHMTKETDRDKIGTRQYKTIQGNGKTRKIIKVYENNKTIFERQDQDKTKTRPREDQDKTKTRPRQDQDKTKTKTQDQDKTKTRPRQDQDERKGEKNAKPRQDKTRQQEWKQERQEPTRKTASALGLC